jgi:hypothetical protein
VENQKCQHGVDCNTWDGVNCYMLKPIKKNKIVHDSDSFEEDEQDKETFCLVL